MLLEGMHIPLTTPFFPNGRLNLRKLEQNTARYSLTPAAGLVVLGTQGEARSLTDDETRQVLQRALGASSATKVMMAGVACDSQSATLDLIEFAARLGYDAILLSVPNLSELSRVELENHLLTITDKSPLSIILSGRLPVELIAEAAFRPKVMGYLSASEEPAEIRTLVEKMGHERAVTVTHLFTAVTRRMSAQSHNLLSAESLTGALTVDQSGKQIKLRTKNVPFQILAGKTSNILGALQAGAVGVLSSLSAATPQACYEVLAAWKDGDLALAAEKQDRLMEAIQLIEGDLGVAGIKYSCDLNGYFGGNPRLPMLPITGDQRAKIESLMQGLS